MRCVIVHNELVVDEERTENVRKVEPVEDDGLGLGGVCGLRYISLYVSNLLLTADWGTRVGDSGKTVFTKLRSHVVSGS